MTSVALSSPLLLRLTNEALATFLGQAERFEASLAPGFGLALCHEPVADLNMICVGSRANEGDRFTKAVRRLLADDQPFLAMIFPEAGDAVTKVAEELGLVYATDFPVMVREDAPIEPTGAEGVHALEVREVEDEASHAGLVQVLAGAFEMPPDSVQRATPLATFQSPSLDAFLAECDGEPACCVTLTYHGDVCGIWAMGSDPAFQSRGIGRRLLTTAMATARERGARRFFLGATPAGKPLYDSLGFETNVVTQVWVNGETAQA